MAYITLDEFLGDLIQRSARSVTDQGQDWLESPDIPTDFDVWIHSQLVGDVGEFNLL